MAINYELINKGGISVNGNFGLLSEIPLDARLVIPTLDGLQNLIDNAAAYVGMIAYITSEGKHYQVNADGSYREFGINQEELEDLIATATIAAMEFKGATASLPATATKGDMYKISGSFEVAKENDAQGAGFTTKVGDSIVYDGAKWYLIPSADDIEDTWRIVKVGDTSLGGIGDGKELVLTAGDKLAVKLDNEGKVVYSHATIAEPALLAQNEQTRTYITAVETDGHGHITGYKTATENVENTDTTYTFECQTEHSNVYFNVTPKGATEPQQVCVDAYTRNEVDTVISGVKTESTNQAIAVLAEAQNYTNEKVGALVAEALTWGEF